MSLATAPSITPRTGRRLPANRLGALTSVWGANTINVTNAGAARSTITFASLTGGLINGGSVLNFTAQRLSDTTANKVIFTAAPTLVPATTGILQRAFINGDGASPDFATYTAANGISGLHTYDVTNNLCSLPRRRR